MKKNDQLNKKFLLILLLACLGFIVVLAFFDHSPKSLAVSVYKIFRNKKVQYDNSNLYHFSKPLDELETVSSFLKSLDYSEKKFSINDNIGIDVTESFRSYANLSKDFSSLSNIITTWDNKYLAFKNRYLFLFEIAGDKIFLKRLALPGIEEIRYAFIFKSGNILFCDHNQAYYSHDNLSTYHKSNIIDIDGKPYKPNHLGNFFNLVIDGRQIIDGKEVRVWGNYTNYGTWQPGVKRSEQMQVWYTTDEGKTLKTAFKIGAGNPNVLARHIHAVNMCPWDNSFWVQTGDMNNECHWIQGKYNWEKDSWSWELKASGDQMSFCKTTGFVFFDNYVYWADDSRNPKNHGIWKTPYSNLTSKNIDSKLFERVLDNDTEMIELTGNQEGYMIASQYFKSPDNKYKVFITNDGGKNWLERNTAFQIVNVHPPNTFGYILGNYFINQQTFEAVQYWDLSPSLFINSYLSNTQVSK